MKKLFVLGIILSCAFLYGMPANDEDPESWAASKFLRLNPQLRCDRGLFEQQDPFFNPALRGLEQQRSQQPAYISGAELDWAVNPAWKALGPVGGDIMAMAVSPKNKNEMAALATGGGYAQVYISTKSGKSWKRKAIINSTSSDIAFDPKDPNKLYVLSYRSLYTSPDSGSNWDYTYFPGNFNASLGGFSIHPQNPKIIYISGNYTYDTKNWKRCMAVLKTTNGGDSWTIQKLNSSSDYAYTYFVRMDPSDPNTLYAGGYMRTSSGTKYKLYKTGNAGGSWKDISGSMSGYMEDIAIHPHNSNKLLVASAWGIYRSLDGGASWQKSSTYCEGYSLTVDASDPDTVYAGYSGNVYKSTDWGLKFTEINKGITGTCRRMLAASNTIFYASTAGLYASTNKGGTWKASHAGIKSVSIKTIAIAPSSTKTMYAEATQNGFFKSVKYGKKMKRMPDFYRCDAVLDISVFPNDAQKLYILAGG